MEAMDAAEKWLDVPQVHACSYHMTLLLFKYILQNHDIFMQKCDFKVILISYDK